MALKFDTRPIKVDQLGHQIGGGQFVQNEINIAGIQTTNRVTMHAETGRLSDSGGRARETLFLATPLFVDVDVSGTIGGTKATTDASLALVNDGLAAVHADCATFLAALGLTGAVYAGGGTANSPILVITGAGILAVTGATAAIMNPIRDQIDTNMHVAGALVNKIMRAVRMHPLDIETNPMREPPPDDYAQGSVGFNPPDQVSPDDPTRSDAGSGRAFGTDSPFTDPTPAITEDSGAANATGITKVAVDAALDNWRNNIETMAQRLAVATNTVAALTDSSTGTAQADRTLDFVITDVVDGFDADIADVGTDLAQKADTDASMVEVRDAIQELAEKARELASGVGAGDFVYDGGGSGLSSVIAAIDDTITDAATGATKAVMDPWAVTVDEAFDMIAVAINRVCDEVDVLPVVRAVFALGTTSSGNTAGNPVNRDVTDTFATNGLVDPFPGSTIAVSSGTAADPGQLSANIEGALLRAKNNVALLASVINECRTALGANLVKII